MYCIEAEPQRTYVQSEFRQGNVQSPIPFVPVVNYILHVALSEGRGGLQWTMISLIRHLDYADDIYIFSIFCLLLFRLLKKEKQKKKKAQNSGENICASGANI